MCHSPIIDIGSPIEEVLIEPALTCRAATLIDQVQNLRNLRDIPGYLKVWFRDGSHVTETEFVRFLGLGRLSGVVMVRHMVGL